MIRRPAGWAAVLLLTGATAAAAAPGEVCVTNMSGEELLFVAEIEGGERRVETLADGSTLCSGPGSAGTGVIGVFEDADALEGCSWVVAAGGTEVLEEYASYDNCRWAGRG